jgi:hypothetical protein
MKGKLLTIVTVLTLALGAALLGSASATEAAGKPGLSPGKWVGTGTISGSVTDDAATTTFSGKIGFQLTVRKNLLVHGDGSWVKTMKGRGFVDSDMVGIAQLTIGGRFNDLLFDHIESVEGTITANGITKRVEFGDEEFRRSHLVLTSVAKCKARGFIPTADAGGAKMTWTARRLGKCR